MSTNELETNRLKLRAWKAEDYSLFANLNADSVVMEYFPATLSAEESNRMADRINERMTARGWGLWATELKSTNEFIGFVGLNVPSGTLPFSPCVEIGWRLDRKFWGIGYATEAAMEALRFGFEELELDEIVAFTSTHNYRSRAVMYRLGMQDTGENFFHPDIDRNHPLCEHVLYKITRY